MFFLYYQDTCIVNLISGQQFYGTLGSTMHINIVCDIRYNL